LTAPPREPRLPSSKGRDTVRGGQSDHLRKPSGPVTWLVVRIRDLIRGQGVDGRRVKESDRGMGNRSDVDVSSAGGWWCQRALSSVAVARAARWSELDWCRKRVIPRPIEAVLVFWGPDRTISRSERCSWWCPTVELRFRSRRNLSVVRAETAWWSKRCAARIHR